MCGHVCSFLCACAEIFNAEFHCGRAEDILPQLVAEESSADVVGILDPPRGGISECTLCVMSCYWYSRNCCAL